MLHVFGRNNGKPQVAFTAERVAVRANGQLHAPERAGAPGHARAGGSVGRQWALSGLPGTFASVQVRPLAAMMGERAAITVFGRRANGELKLVCNDDGRGLHLFTRKGGEHVLGRTGQTGGVVPLVATDPAHGGDWVVGNRYFTELVLTDEI